MAYITNNMKQRNKEQKKGTYKNNIACYLLNTETNNYIELKTID